MRWLSFPRGKEPGKAERVAKSQESTSSELVGCVTFAWARFVALHECALPGAEPFPAVPTARSRMRGFLAADGRGQSADEKLTASVASSEIVPPSGE